MSGFTCHTKEKKVIHVWFCMFVKIGMVYCFFFFSETKKSGVCVLYIVYILQP